MEGHSLHARLDRGLLLHTFLLFFPLTRRASTYTLSWRSILCFLNILVFCSIALYVFTIVHSPSAISAWLVRTRLAIYSVIFISSIAMPTIRRSELTRAVQNMVRVDQEFATKQIQQIRPIWCIVFLLIAALLRLSFSISPGNLTKFFFSYFAPFYCLLVTDQFSIFLHVIRSQFETLKEELVRANSTSNFTVMGNLCLSYRKLTLASIGFNRIFSVQLLFIHIILFFLATSELFYIFNTLIGTRHLSNVVLVATKSCWTIYAAYMIFYISSQSQLTSKKADEFNNLLYQFMIENKSNEILNNEKIRLHIFNRRKVVFTACDFFNFDYSLVHSLVASATIYLVILVQFGQAPPIVPLLTFGNTTVGNATAVLNNVTEIFESTTEIMNNITVGNGHRKTE